MGGFEPAIFMAEPHDLMFLTTVRENGAQTTEVIPKLSLSKTMFWNRNADLTAIAVLILSTRRRL